MFWGGFPQTCACSCCSPNPSPSWTLGVSQSAPGATCHTPPPMSAWPSMAFRTELCRQWPVWPLPLSRSWPVCPGKGPLVPPDSQGTRGDHTLGTAPSSRLVSLVCWQAPQGGEGSGLVPVVTLSPCAPWEPSTWTEGRCHFYAAGLLSMTSFSLPVIQLDLSMQGPSDPAQLCRGEASWAPPAMPSGVLLPLWPFDHLPALPTTSGLHSKKGHGGCWRMWARVACVPVKSTPSHAYPLALGAPGGATHCAQSRPSALGGPAKAPIAHWARHSQPGREPQAAQGSTRPVWGQRGDTSRPLGPAKPKPQGCWPEGLRDCGQCRHRAGAQQQGPSVCVPAALEPGTEDPGTHGARPSIAQPGHPHSLPSGGLGFGAVVSRPCERRCRPSASSPPPAPQPHEEGAQTLVGWGWGA